MVYGASSRGGQRSQQPRRVGESVPHMPLCKCLSLPAFPLACPLLSHTLHTHTACPQDPSLPVVARAGLALGSAGPSITMAACCEVRGRKQLCFFHSFLCTFFFLCSHTCAQSEFWRWGVRHRLLCFCGNVRLRVGANMSLCVCRKKPNQARRVNALAPPLHVLQHQHHKLSVYPPPAQVLAFGLGALTSMPAVRNFSICAAIAVGLDFLLQVRG